MMVSQDPRRQQVPTVYDPSNNILFGPGPNSLNPAQQMRGHMLQGHPPPIITTGHHLHPNPSMQMHSMQLSPHSPNHPHPSHQLPQLPLPPLDPHSDFVLEDQQHAGDGFPTPPQFEDLLNGYILSLSPKKRDKALIPQKRYDNILAVLRDPKCTTIESAQFRFWAKKMFRLVMDDGGLGVVCHEGKPVAVREQLYDVLTAAHGQASHGGRDKTSAQVRKYYSW